MHAMAMFIIITVALCKFIIYLLAAYSAEVSNATAKKVTAEHILLSRSY